MKKIAILAMAVIATATSYAQVTTTFGIKAGVQNNLLVARETGGGSDERIAYTGLGFHIGGIADLKFSEHFSVQPQLLFASKGIKVSDETRIDLLNIDIPINLLYRNNGFFIGAGPSFSYGISGKIKEDGSDDEDVYEEVGGESFFKRFDFGVNTTLGYEFPGGLLLSANYTAGLSNLSNMDGTDGEYNHRAFGFSIGYLFNKGAAKKK
jgi:hypothetical protein